MTIGFSEVINKYQGVAPQNIINAVRNAAHRTGADFSFLMEKASAESNFNPNSKAKTSSATGLFQFIESTWLDVVKKYGAKYGLGNFAKEIKTDKSGKLCVDCNKKQEILELRKNPRIASFMAAEFSAENKRYIEKHSNIKIGATELYFAHFMGAKAATNFINKKEANGREIAANLFPKEAAANKNVFFDKGTKKARTLNEVYNFFDKKFKNKEINFKGETLPSSYPNAFSENTQNANIGFTTTVPVYSYPTLKAAQALLSFNQRLSTSNYSNKYDDNYSDSFSKTMKSYAQRIYSDAINLMAQTNIQRNMA